MRHFIFRLLVTCIAVLVVAKFLPGIQVDGPMALLWAVLILGLFNAFLRPIMIFLTLPITFITFGLFIFVINGLLLYLTSLVVKGFHIQSFWIALLAAILISLVSGFISWLAKGQQ
jgi:putative membrane protein